MQHSLTQDHASASSTSSLSPAFSLNSGSGAAQALGAGAPEAPLTAEQQREQARKSWEEGLATQDGNIGGKRKIG